MKREAVGHTKMKRLCRRLDIPLYQGAGILELIWHTTAREAPRGDIGKLSDEDIALAIDYRGNESEMIEALVASGWLDRDPAERLAVHDWADHADDAVQMRLARGRLFFVGGRAPKLSKLTGDERKSAHEFYSRAPEPAHDVPTNADSVRTDGAQNDDVSALPEPEPVPEPEPEPVITKPCSPPESGGERAGQVSFDESELKAPPAKRAARRKRSTTGLSPEQAAWFAQWWPIYWRHESKKDTEKAFAQMVCAQEVFDQVMTATLAQTPRMLERDMTKRPLGATWLRGERWNDEVEPVGCTPSIYKDTRGLEKQERINQRWEAMKSPRLPLI